MADYRPNHEDRLQAISRLARAGLGVLGMYTVFYAAFVLLGVFAPDILGDPYVNIIASRRLALDMGGLNVALVYGVFLIVAAVVLSMLYLRRQGRTRR